MRLSGAGLSVGLFVASLFATSSVAVDRASAPHIEVSLVADEISAEAGDELRIGVHFEPDPGWHVYWRNPGDTGMPMALDWQFPEGSQAGELRWPVPHRIEVVGFVNYGYEEPVLLERRLRLPAEATGPEWKIAVALDWLVCKEECIPGDAELSLQIPVGSSQGSADASLFDKAARHWPIAASDLGIEAQATLSESGYRIELKGFDPDSQVESLGFMPSDSEVIEYSEPQIVAIDGDVVSIDLPASVYASEPTDRLRGVLVGDLIDAPGVALDLAVGTSEIAARPPSPSTDPTTSSEPRGSLWLALLLALLGGATLNLMPCVFPVLSLKVLGFVESAGRGGAIGDALSFAAGVIVSFLALAGGLLALRAGGQSLGWGFQLQEPAFVVALALLLFVLGLWLSGLLELGSGLAGLFSHQRSAFASGILATVVATPCTAPFMGTALGWALQARTWEALAVFATLGLGMAAPYVLLAANPALLRRLPRPGQWMITFKEALAFPLYATVIWLAWVLGQQAGVDAVIDLAGALLLTALSAWTLGRFGDARQPTARFAVRLASTAGLIGAIWLATPSTQVREQVSSDAYVDSWGQHWEPWSESTVAARLGEGRRVYVDFTAAWCLSCQVNKKVVFASSAVRRAIEADDVALLRADWTSRDPVIASALESFGRSGVPLNLVYHPEAGAPRVLPAVLTPGLVLNALGSDVPGGT